MCFLKSCALTQLLTTTQVSLELMNFWDLYSRDVPWDKIFYIQYILTFCFPFKMFSFRLKINLQVFLFSWICISQSWASFLVCFCLSSPPASLKLLCSFRLQSFHIGTDCVYAVSCTGLWCNLCPELPVTNNSDCIGWLALSGKTWCFCGQIRRLSKET